MSAEVEFVRFRIDGVPTMPRPVIEDNQRNLKKVEIAEVVSLSGRDFARVLELLEYPPKPNAKLRAAIAALPDTV